MRLIFGRRALSDVQTYTNICQNWAICSLFIQMFEPINTHVVVVSIESNRSHSDRLFGSNTCKLYFTTIAVSYTFLH